MFAPLYRQIDRSKLDLWPVEFLRDVPLQLGPHRLSFSVLATRLPGSQATVYLIDAPALFERERIYGNAPDEHLRFILLTHAAFLCCQRMAFAPHILHCNDWHTGFGPLLLKTVYAWDRLFHGTRSLMSIHNLAYQGVFGSAVSPDIGLGSAADMLDAAALYGGRVNPLREGIAHAHAVSTVSPTYALEIQTPEYGYGLDGLLRSRAGSLTGILNGVDYEEWDPATDRFLTRHFDAGSLDTKQVLKRALMLRLGLAAPPRIRTPLIGMVSQKGFDLLMTALPALLEKHASVAPSSAAARSATRLFSAAWQRNTRPACICASATAKSMRTGSKPQRHVPDALAVRTLRPQPDVQPALTAPSPSCGVPAGLNDSVRHFDPASGEGTGIVFNDYDVGAGDLGHGDRARLVREEAAVAAADGERDGARISPGNAASATTWRCTSGYSRPDGLSGIVRQSMQSQRTGVIKRYVAQHA